MWYLLKELTSPSKNLSCDKKNKGCVIFFKETKTKVSLCVYNPYTCSEVYLF